MVRRRTQTDRAPCTDTSTETPSALVTTVCTGTEPVDTADRSTLTAIQTTSDRTTTTDYLIVTRDQETFTCPPLFVNSSTVTERVRTRTEGTQHERSGHSCKMTMTKRPIYLERETNTPTVAKYDCEVTARILGEDKGTSTRVVITTDFGCGGGDVSRYEFRTSRGHALVRGSFENRVRQAEVICICAASKNTANCHFLNKSNLDLNNCDGKKMRTDNSDCVLDAEEADDVSTDDVTAVRCIDEFDDVSVEDLQDTTEWNELYYESVGVNNRLADCFDGYRNPTDTQIERNQKPNLDNTICSSSTQCGVLSSNRDICRHSKPEDQPFVVNSNNENEDKAAHDEYREQGRANRYTRSRVTDDRNPRRDGQISSGYYQNQTANVSCSSQTDWKHFCTRTISSDPANQADHECIFDTPFLSPSSSFALTSSPEITCARKNHSDCTELQCTVDYRESFFCIACNLGKRDVRCNADTLFKNSLDAVKNDDKLFCTHANCFTIAEPCYTTERCNEKNTPTGKCSVEKESTASVKPEAEIDFTTNTIIEGTVAGSRVDCPDDSLLLQDTGGAVPAADAVDARGYNNKRSGSALPDEMTLRHPFPFATHSVPTSVNTPPLPCHPPTSSFAPTDLQLLLTSTAARAVNSQQQCTIDTGLQPAHAALGSATEMLSVTAVKTETIRPNAEAVPSPHVGLTTQSQIAGDLLEKTSLKPQVISEKTNCNINSSTLAKSKINSAVSVGNRTQNMPLQSSVNIPSSLGNKIALNDSVNTIYSWDTDRKKIVASLVSLQNELNNSAQLLSNSLQNFSRSQSEELLTRIFSTTSDALRFIQICPARENNKHKVEHRNLTISEDVKSTKFELGNDEGNINRPVRTVSSTMCDVETSTLVTSLTCGTNTPRIFRVDAGVETRPITTVDSATTMHRPPTLIDKETCTPTVHHIHKNVATHNEPMVDKQTEMAVDVTAAYRMGTLLSCTPSVFVSRGTLTSHPITADRSTFVRGLVDLEGLVERATSPMRTLDKGVTVERGSSPIRPLCFDKSVMATKGEALEPMDKYQAVGKVSASKILRPLLELSRVRKPKLDSICESLGDMEEEEEEEKEEEEEIGDIIGRVKALNCDITVSHSSHLITSGDSVFMTSQNVKRQSSFSTASDLKVNRKLDRLKYSLQPVSPRPTRPPFQSGAGPVFDFDSR